MEVKCDEMYAPIAEDIFYPYIEPILDIKPTVTELQEALVFKIEQLQPESSTCQIQDEKVIDGDQAATPDDNDYDDTAFDIPDTWSDTNSDDYFVTSEDVAEKKPKVAESAVDRGEESLRKKRSKPLQKTTKKQRHKSQESWRPQSESNRYVKRRITTPLFILFIGCIIFGFQFNND